jgi:hypothetical protein
MFLNLNDDTKIECTLVEEKYADYRVNGPQIESKYTVQYSIDSENLKKIAASGIKAIRIVADQSYDFEYNKNKSSDSQEYARCIL